MPVMPGYIHADTPHESTIQAAGYLYGCSSERTGDANPRGQTTHYVASRWGGTPAYIVTEWLPKPCGHTLRSTDPACTGRVNRGAEEDIASIGSGAKICALVPVMTDAACGGCKDRGQQ